MRLMAIFPAEQWASVRPLRSRPSSSQRTVPCLTSSCKTCLAPSPQGHALRSHVIQVWLRSGASMPSSRMIRLPICRVSPSITRNFLGLGSVVGTRRGVGVGVDKNVCGSPPPSLQAQPGAFRQVLPAEIQLLPQACDDRQTRQQLCATPVVVSAASQAKASTATARVALFLVRPVTTINDLFVGGDLQPLRINRCGHHQRDQRPADP